MSTVIYNYCVQYHGVADRYNDADLKTKYKDFSTKDLKKALKCLCIENFEYFFPTEIENLVFLVHDDHIFFALAGEKGIEISVCFEALDANFWWPLCDVIPRIKARTFSRPTEVC